MNIHSRHVNVTSTHKSAAMLEAEKLFSKKQSEPDTHAPPETEKPKQIERLLSLNLSGNSAKFRISKALWEAIGKPDRVDFTGTATHGYQIRPGKKIKIQKGGSASVVAEIYPTQIGLAKEKRSTVQMHAYTKDGYIQTAFVPWMKQDPAPQAPEPKPGALLVSEVKPTEPEEIEDLGTVTVRKNSAGSTLAISIPKKLLIRLDDPKRVTIEGSASQGWTITPTKDEHEGYKLNYALPGNTVYLSRSLADQGIIGKEPRKPFRVRMTLKDGTIRVGGANFEWIRGSAMWLKKADEPDTHHIGRQPGDVTTVHDTSGLQNLRYAMPNVSEESQKMMGDLAGLLTQIKPVMDQARAKIREIYDLTGLKLLIKSDCSVGLDFGVASPKQQAAGSEIKLTVGTGK